MVIIVRQYPRGEKPITFLCVQSVSLFDDSHGGFDHLHLTENPSQRRPLFIRPLPMRRIGRKREQNEEECKTH
jgi:hypothetical protein